MGSVVVLDPTDGTVTARGVMASTSVAGSSVGSDEALLGRVGGGAGPGEVETLVRDVLGGEAGSLLLVEGVDDLEMPGKHVAVGLDVDGVNLAELEVVIF